MRGALLLAGLAGCVLLVLATSADIFKVQVLTTTSVQAEGLDLVQTGSERHGPALVLLAAFALLMLIGAARGARPAMLAVAAAGLAVLLIALLKDADGLDEVVAETRVLYTDVSGSREAGYYYETLGGGLLLLAGGALFLLGLFTRERQAEAAEDERPARKDRDVRRGDDWFAEDPS